MALSYFTFIHNFWVPQAFFWDENYHIASAQKYLTGTFFMEPHPPLGKFAVALGEAVFNFNPEDNQFIETDYASNPPEGFSFTGFRLVPVLLAWLTTLVVFGIFLKLTKNRTWATLLSFLYIFDTAILVHMRSAMLESTMLFFIALTLYGFLLILENKDNAKRLRWAAILFGASFAAALTTKAFALLFILLVPLALWPMRKTLSQCVRFVAFGLLAFAIVYIGVWQLHFSLARTVNPALPDAGYYQASEQYKAILQNSQTSTPFAFPFMLRDSLAFVNHYEAGVPRLDLCKADENGSPWFLWPFGGRSINYRWESWNGSYRYLYLQANPVVWFLGLLGIVFTVAYFLSSMFSTSEERRRIPYPMIVFFTLYVCFMLAVSTIDRVMYLYHYFTPLLFSFFLFGLVFVELERIGPWLLNEQRKTSILLTLSVLIFLSFQFYRPLAFYEPLSDKQFERRNLMQIWELKCVQCQQDSMFVEQTR